MKSLQEILKEGAEEKSIIEEELLNEASETAREEIGKNNLKTVSTVEKLLRIEGVQYFDGIHGIIVIMRREGRGIGIRIDVKDLKKIASLPIRWFEMDDYIVTLGLPYAKN